MRRGELLGLKWDDVDLDNFTVRVQRTLTRKGTGYVLGEPKTKKSRRTIRLTQRAVEALRSHRKRQLEENLAAGNYEDSGLVLAGDRRRSHQPLQPPQPVLCAAPTAC